MYIYIMRHGTAKSGMDDPPLSDGGRRGVGTTAKYIREESIQFDVMVSSPKRRALETAEIVAGSVGYPAEDIVVTELLKPNAPIDEALAFLSRYNDAQSIMLTGHLPSLPRLTSVLIGLSFEVGYPTGSLSRIEAESFATNNGEFLMLFTPDE